VITVCRRVIAEEILLFLVVWRESFGQQNDDVDGEFRLAEEQHSVTAATLIWSGSSGVTMWSWDGTLGRLGNFALVGFSQWIQELFIGRPTEFV
jgi:hypothetical protein